MYNQKKLIFPTILHFLLYAWMFSTIRNRLFALSLLIVDNYSQKYLLNK